MSNFFIAGTGGGGGGGGSLSTLTGNTGGIVSPIGANINVVGTGPIAVAGNNGTATETISIATATSSSIGAIQIATNAQTITGTAIDLAVTPDDLSFKLGTQTNHGFPYSVGSTSVLSWTAEGQDGQIIIGATGGPGLFANMTSMGGTVAITNGPNSINLEAVGSGGLSMIPTDSGTASVSAGAINILGGNNISTSAFMSTVTLNLIGTTNHTVQIGNSSGSLTSLTVGSDGQVLLGANSANPSFATLVSDNGNIIFTPGPNALSIDTSGFVADSFTGDSGTATPVLGDMNIVGSLNIVTSGSANTIAISVSGTTDHSIQLGNATGSLTSLGVAANGFIPIGSAGSNPVLALPTNGNNISWTPGAGSLRADVTGTTNNAVLVGNASGSISSITVATDGMVLIGDTGNAPKFSSLTSSGGGLSFTPGSGTLDINTSGAMANMFTTNSGTATPSLGTLSVIGGANITTSGATNIVTISLNGTTNHALQVGNVSGALTSLAIGATNTVLLGNTGANPSFGTVPNAALTNSSITLSNGNNITITGSPVTLGGTATVSLTGTTNHAVQIGNATGSISSVGVGATGTVLTGSTGADPSFSALGTNSGLTANGVVLAHGNSAFTATTAGGNGQVLIGSTSNASAFATLTSGNNTIVYSPGSNALDLVTGQTVVTSVHSDTTTATPLAGAFTINGGHNITTVGSGQQLLINLSGITNHALAVGTAQGFFQSITPGLSGQVVIGSTGLDPAFATLASAGGTIQYTAGANTLNLESFWTTTETLTASAALVVNRNFISNAAGVVTFTLPAAAAEGSIIRIAGKGGTGWKIAQNAGQTIRVGTLGTTTTGVTGSVSSSGTRDTIELFCINTNTDWSAISISPGSIFVIV